MLITICKFYRHLCSSDFISDTLTFGIKCISEFFRTDISRIGKLNCAAVGGHKKLWLYYFAKSHKDLYLYKIQTSLFYAAGAGHLDMCKVLYRLYKQKCENNPIHLLKTDHDDINMLIVSNN